MPWSQQYDENYNSQWVFYTTNPADGSYYAAHVQAAAPSLLDGLKWSDTPNWWLNAPRRNAGTPRGNGMSYGEALNPYTGQWEQLGMIETIPGEITSDMILPLSAVPSAREGADWNSWYAKPFTGFDLGTFIGDKILTSAGAFAGAFLFPDIGTILAGQGSFIPTFAENAAFAAADAAEFGTALAPAGVITSVAADSASPIDYTAPAETIDPAAADSAQFGTPAAPVNIVSIVPDLVAPAETYAEYAARMVSEGIDRIHGIAQSHGVTITDAEARVLYDDLSWPEIEQSIASTANDAAQFGIPAAPAGTGPAWSAPVPYIDPALVDSAQFGTSAAPAGTGPAWSAPALPVLPTTAPSLPTVSLKDLQTVASLAKTGAGVVAAVMGAGAATNHTGLPTTTPIVQGTPGVNQSPAFVGNSADAVSAQNPMLMFGLAILALKLLALH